MEWDSKAEVLEKIASFKESIRGDAFPLYTMDKMRLAMEAFVKYLEEMAGKDDATA